MTDLTMNLATNDLDFTGGNLSLASGIDEIVQNWQQRLQVWSGEWFLDTSQGVPYRQQVFVKSPNLDLIQSALVSESLKVPGIYQITNLSYQFDSTDRVLSVSMEAQSINGDPVTAQTTIALPQNQTIQGSPYP